MNITYIYTMFYKYKVQCTMVSFSVCCCCKTTQFFWINNSVFPVFPLSSPISGFLLNFLIFIVAFLQYCMYTNTYFLILWNIYLPLFTFCVSFFFLWDSHCNLYYKYFLGQHVYICEFVIVYNMLLGLLRYDKHQT